MDLQLTNLNFRHTETKLVYLVIFIIVLPPIVSSCIIAILLPFFTSFISDAESTVCAVVKL